MSASFVRGCMASSVSLSVPGPTFLPSSTKWFFLVASMRPSVTALSTSSTMAFSRAVCSCSMRSLFLFLSSTLFLHASMTSSSVAVSERPSASAIAFSSMSVNVFVTLLLLLFTYMLLSGLMTVSSSEEPSARLMVLPFRLSTMASGFAPTSTRLTS